MFYTADEEMRESFPLRKARYVRETTYIILVNKKLNCLVGFEVHICAVDSGSHNPPLPRARLPNSQSREKASHDIVGIFHPFSVSDYSESLSPSILFIQWTPICRHLDNVGTGPQPRRSTIEWLRNAGWDANGV